MYVALPSYTSFSPLQSQETIPLGTAAYIEPTWTRVRRGPCSGGGRCCGRSASPPGDRGHYTTAGPLIPNAFQLLYCRHDTCVVHALADMERMLRLGYAKIRSQPPTSGCIVWALIHLQ
jgi:hypothetical protein